MSSLISYTFQETKYLKEEAIWRELSKVTVRRAMESWLHPMTPCTKRCYRLCFSLLERYGLINLDMDLQSFSMINHKSIIMKFREYFPAEATKQTRTAPVVSFIKYLHSLSEGVIKDIDLTFKGREKLFKKIRFKSKTDPVNPNDWTKLLRYTYEHSLIRERIIMIFLLQGGKRINEVLKVNLEDVDFENKRIFFKQSKAKYVHQETVINFPDHVFKDIREYIGDRTSGPLFLNNRNANRLTYLQAYRYLKSIASKIGIQFSSHMLRVSCVTYLRSNGYSDADIQKVTGHASLQLISYYDKSDLWNNPTMTIDLSKVYDDKTDDTRGIAEHCQQADALGEEKRDIQEVSSSGVLGNSKV